jgi:drug/metabolite transporter (DMT)-like permease
MVATVVVWGSAFTGIKVLAAYLDPVDLAVVRFAFAVGPFVALWAVFRPKWRRRGRLDAGGAWRVFLLGALAVPCYHVALNAGEARMVATASVDVAASVSALLVATTPLFTFLLAVPLLGERATVRRVAGLIVALMGVGLLVVWGRGVRMEPAAMVGALLVLLAPLSWALYSVLLKRELSRGGGPLEWTTYTLLAGSLLMAPLTSTRIATGAAAMPAGAWVWAAWLGLAATFGGYVVWNLALRHWDATRVSSFVYLVPLSAITWAVLLADERVTVQLVAGGGLILAGVWLASSRRRRRPGPNGRPRPVAPD